MSSTTPGTAITAMIAANSAPRPRKRSRASAYPASESKNTRPTVTQHRDQDGVAEPEREVGAGEARSKAAGGERVGHRRQRVGGGVRRRS